VWIAFPCPAFQSQRVVVGTTAGREIRVEAKIPARDFEFPCLAKPPSVPCRVAGRRLPARDFPAAFGEKQRQYTTSACISVVNNPEYAKAGRLIEAKAEPVPGAIEPKATSIG
jgi:hypothetical protein